LAEGGKLVSSVETLRSFGFERACVAEPNETPLYMARCAATRALADAGITASEIGALVYASAIAPSSLSGGSDCGPGVLHVERLDDLFRYPAPQLLYELGLTHASAIGVNQQGCGGMFGALRMARALLIAEPELGHVLCVAADRFPSEAPREVIYNIVSDAACALVLSAGHARYSLRECYQLTKGYYWDGAALRNELVASYFPTARAAIRRALEHAELSVDEIDWVVPHNVGLSGWEILLGTLGIPESRLYGRNIARYGHSIAADNVINLCDMEAEGLIQPGQHLLLFTFGFGANWSVAILER
jgi:3-oxoacyl-[acyl-carrier-protein] synthase-3